MGFFDFFKSASSESNEVSVRKDYNGNQLVLVFSTCKGHATVVVDTAPGPGGRRGVMYDCFMVALNRWMQQGMEESEFIDDMKKVMGYVASGKTSQETMNLLLREHISDKGRLIDSDLCTYISELYLATKALNGSCNRQVLLDEMMQVAERNFGNNLYITQYRRVGMGLQPYLVSFSDFVRNVGR